MGSRLEGALWRGGLVGWLAKKILRIRWHRLSIIPSGAKLWRCIHQRDDLYQDGRIKPAFFRDRKGLSCDLARLSTAKRSRRGYAPKPWPKNAGLVEFCAGAVRELGSDVRHEPTTEPLNYSHCQFTIDLSTELARELSAKSAFRIPQRLREVKSAR